RASSTKPWLVWRVSWAPRWVPRSRSRLDRRAEVAARTYAVRARAARSARRPRKRARGCHVEIAMVTAPGASVGFGSIAWPVVVGRAFGCNLAREESLDEAMNRYAQGEQSAFAILYEGFEQKLRAFLTRLTGAPA